MSLNMENARVLICPSCEKWFDVGWDRADFDDHVAECCDHSDLNFEGSCACGEVS